MDVDGRHRRLRSPADVRSLAKPASIVTALAAFAIHAAGCGADDVPRIVWEGDALRFRTDADVSSICAGTLPYVDESVAYLADVFGSRDPHVDFYWVPDRIEAFCDDANVYGCAQKHEVFSIYAVNQHEIVHALRERWAYRPLEEGIAELYGNDWKWSSDPDPSWLAEIYEINDGVAPGWYATVGHFASFLRAAEGEQKLLEIASRSDQRDSFDATRELVSSIYAVSFEDLVAEYEETYVVCDNSYFRDTGLDCDRNVVGAPGPGDEAVVLDVSLDCDDANVIGPQLGERWTTITIEVPTTARYVLSIGPRDQDLFRPYQVQARRCGASCYDASEPVTTEQFLAGGDFCLQQGRYTFRLSLQDDESSDFVFHVAYDRATDACSP